MIYVGPAWKFARGAYLSKLLSLQNNALRMFGEFPKNIRIHETHVAFEIPYVYDFITNLCRQQAVTRNHANENICNSRKEEASQMKRE
jgi:hypothetical protein